KAMMASYRSTSLVALPFASAITSCASPGSGSRTSLRAMSSVPGAQAAQSGEMPTRNVGETDINRARSTIIIADDLRGCQVFLFLLPGGKPLLAGRREGCGGCRL